MGNVNLGSGTQTNIDTIQAGRDVHVGDKHVHLSEDPRAWRNRQVMLKRVRETWITGLLEHSLAEATRLELGLKEAPDAVTDPRRLWLTEVDRPPQPLPPGTTIVDVYDSSSSGLLILGAPGAGKTTLLLELARALLDPADADPTLPIPVVFPLASWAAKRLPLAPGDKKDELGWLVTELVEKYQVQRAVGQPWVAGDALVLLLDGLDEVAAEHRAACVAVINAFRRDHGTVSVVVTCREAEYKTMASLLMLGVAVAVQPLTAEQIEAYLVSGGLALAGLRATLDADSALMEMAQAPLMLNVLALAYRGVPAEMLEAPTSQQQVFAAYVERMLRHRKMSVPYTPEQTLQWLGWLARQMNVHEQTEFYIERMQPDWLAGSARWLYKWLRGLGVGLVFGIFGAVFGGLLGGFSTVLVIGLVVGLVVGLVSSLVFELNGSSNTIWTAEVLVWSWTRRWQQMLVSLVFGLVVALIGWLGGGLNAALVSGLFGVIGTGLVFGFSTEALDDHQRIRPNQGIWLSARNGLVVGLVSGLVSGLIGGLGFGLFEGLSWGLVRALGFGLVGGLFGGLGFGWDACVQHIVLRLFLWLSGATPRNYVQFLDQADERILLRKVGGGYIFIHRLLLEHFVGLEPDSHLSPPKELEAEV